MIMLRRSGSEGAPQNSSNFLSVQRSKKIWSTEEDELLKTLVETHGTTNWTLIAESLPERTGKQCRERWHNHLEDGIKKGDWTEEEDKVIITLQRAIGNQWAKITKMLPGRTDNAVKNRFHATERAKSRGRCHDDLYAIPINDAFVDQLKKLNGDDIDLSDLYRAGVLKDSKHTATATATVMEAASVPRATASARPSTSVVPMATASSFSTQGDALLMGPANPTLTATPVGMATRMGSGSNTTFQLAFTEHGGEANAEADEEEYDEEEYDEEGERALDGLMDLDVISFDEDDMGFNFMEGADGPDVGQERAANCCGADLDTNACCSMNFDWGFSSREFSLGFGNSLPDPLDVTSVEPQQDFQQQQQLQQQQQQQSTSNYTCGLEAWGSISHNSQFHHFQQQHNQNYLQQQQQPQQQQQQQQGYFSPSATTFFCSS